MRNLLIPVFGCGFIHARSAAMTLMTTTAANAHITMMLTFENGLVSATSSRRKAARRVIRAM